MLFFEAGQAFDARRCERTPVEPGGAGERGMGRYNHTLRSRKVCELSWRSLVRQSRLAAAEGGMPVYTQNALYHMPADSAGGGPERYSPPLRVCLTPFQLLRARPERGDPAERVGR